MSVNPFVRKNGPLTKQRAKELVASGLQRAIGSSRDGKAEVALAAGCTSRCIEKALSHDTLPSIETLFNALAADETILNEFLSHYGYRLTSITADPAHDLHTAAGLSHAAGSLIDAHADGNRCHRETLEVADKLRPLLPQITAIIHEADSLRGVA